MPRQWADAPRAILNRCPGTLPLACLLGYLAPTVLAQPLTVLPLPDSNVAGLAISHPRLSDNVFGFGTCEAVLDGDRDFGLFQVKLAAPPKGSLPAWQIDARGLGYTWRYPQGIVVQYRAEPASDAVACSYTVRNQSATPLARVHLHTCVTTTRAPAFFPAAFRAADAGSPSSAANDDLTELYERVFLWSRGQRFSFSEGVPGHQEVHLAFMREGETPIHWAWWVNAERTFDTPLIAVASRDGRWTAGLWFETAVWASCNTGDDRACFHLFPLFGTLAPGESVTVRGKFFLLAGTPDDLYQRITAPADASPGHPGPTTHGRPHDR